MKIIAATELVVGDMLEIEAGDAVPADARLLQTISLSAEESALTGESVPTQKDARAAVADDAPLGDRATMLFVGTSIIRGKGALSSSRRGVRTELGKLSELIHRPRDRTTPLEEKLQSFGKRILWGCLGLSAVLFARGMITGRRSWHELLLEAVSLAVAAIPEGLPAITTITLALGMQRMAKRGAIVRKLAAVETLGAATVICTDKTGTLTQNEMTVREVYAGRTELSRHRQRLRPARRHRRRREQDRRRIARGATSRSARDGRPLQQRHAAQDRRRVARPGGPHGGSASHACRKAAAWPASRS